MNRKSTETTSCTGGVRNEPHILNIKYFAAIRECRGCSEEQMETGARTPGELYEQLRERHALDLDKDALQVAVNDQLSSWDTQLHPGDTVAFLPPVAGG